MAVSQWAESFKGSRGRMDARRPGEARACGGGLDGGGSEGDGEETAGRHVWGESFGSEAEAKESARRAGRGWEIRARAGHGPMTTHQPHHRILLDVNTQ